MILALWLVSWRNGSVSLGWGEFGIGRSTECVFYMCVNFVCLHLTVSSREEIDDAVHFLENVH